ncbi:MAG TPA: hypothetical protein DCY20_03280, partial [Firmicutes bacterium]|nr:hypothetical protein [Bacillota bacterium]
MEVYIARQPIFDLNMNVVAYELLHRSNDKNQYIGVDPDEATSDVIINTFQNFGIANLTEGKRAFINFTEKLIFDEVATIFPNDILVIEVLETVRPTRMLIERCKQLKRLGYTIVLDDF